MNQLQYYIHDSLFLRGIANENIVHLYTVIVGSEIGSCKRFMQDYKIYLQNNHIVVEGIAKFNTKLITTNITFRSNNLANIKDKKFNTNIKTFSNILDRYDVQPTFDIKLKKLIFRYEDKCLDLPSVSKKNYLQKLQLAKVKYINNSFTICCKCLVKIWITEYNYELFGSCFCGTYPLLKFTKGKYKNKYIDLHNVVNNYLYVVIGLPYELCQLIISYI